MNISPITAGLGEDSGQEKSSEVVSLATPSDTREGFTAGPWKLKFEPPTPDYEYPYMTLIASAGDFGNGDGFNITGIVKEADARLIAAAPDMLAALKECAAEFRSGPCTVTEGYAIAAHEFLRRMEIASAAISKATGA